MLRALGLSPEQFALRDPYDVACFLMSKFSRITPGTIAQARSALVRLLRHLFDTGIGWEDHFGHLHELDLYGFLMRVHFNAVARGSDKRPGHEAAWGVLKGLGVLQARLSWRLPLDSVRACLPTLESTAGTSSRIAGARPLPPEVLPLLFKYVSRQDAPPVLRSWAFALAFSTVSSLRQTNAQHIAFYGFLKFGGRDFLLSQHADGKSQGKQAKVIVTPLQDLDGCSAWFFDGVATLPAGADFLWADHHGPPERMTSRVLNCPLPEAAIQRALRLVLQVACGMSAEEADLYTKHSARKTIVSLAQAGGCPWETQVELGHWGHSSLDRTLLLPAEDLRRKHSLACLDLPARYSCDARVRRVARILIQQLKRLAGYLVAKSGAGFGRFDTRWELVPLYHPAEGQ